MKLDPSPQEMATYLAQDKREKIAEKKSGMSPCPISLTRITQGKSFTPILFAIADKKPGMFYVMMWSFGQECLREKTSLSICSHHFAFLWNITKLSLANNIWF